MGIKKPAALVTAGFKECNQKLSRLMEKTGDILS